MRFCVVKIWLVSLAFCRITSTCTQLLLEENDDQNIHTQTELTFLKSAQKESTACIIYIAFHCFENH